MIVNIEKSGDFFIVYYCDREISRKKTLVQATKALAKFVKGQI